MSSMYSLGWGLYGEFPNQGILSNSRERIEKSLESGKGLAAKVGLAFGSVVGFIVT